MRAEAPSLANRRRWVREAFRKSLVQSIEEGELWMTFSSWMVGLVMFLLFMAHNAYRVCYVPVRTESNTESSTERSRHKE